MIFSVADFDDNGFLLQTYQGLLRAENELDVVGSVYTSTNPSDYEPQVQQCAQDGNDICIGVSYPLFDAISSTAPSYPAIKFAIVDGSYDNYPSNLRGILFSSEEVGYLAGTLAARMSQSGTIGDLGGMEIPPVTTFTEGYRNGAGCADPEITTIISYTNVFTDPDLGAQFAQGMIAQGADVIFAVAGGTGNGALLTATQSGVWAIGVDTDQYLTVFMSGTVPGSDHLLTSATKRTDNAVFNTISDVISGTFTSGTIIYDLSDAGVELAPFHETDPFILADVRTQLRLVERAILSGSIDPLDPGSPCLEIHNLYLPITTRD